MGGLQGDYMSNSIPTKLWLLWFQGLDEAPYLVQKCIESWVKKNPTWEITVLDNSNLHNYMDTTIFDNELSKLPLVKKSNLVRLRLLEEYGGVWADATTYCTTPLDEWIQEATTSSGFFVFHKPGPDRVMSNWFMASEKNSKIISKLKQDYISFFSNNNFNVNTKAKKNFAKKIGKILNRSANTTLHWFSPLFTKILKIHPYAIFHYMFYRLVTNDTECRKIWDKTKKISADGPHRIQRFGMLASPDDIIKKEIDEKKTTVYKLTWKYKHENYSSSSVLHYLFESE